ncbi:MAG: flagellar hook-associated protein 3, partial [candidate division Zixibacteria bacterium]|nr:flagellar hook-associated protein 3 [candidate division Zixibacteria bacterium]
MRVSNSMMVSSTLNDLSQIYSRMMRTQKQLSSGRRINAPSDDPVGVSRALAYRNYLGELDQYNRNIQRVRSILNHTDYSLGSINDFTIQAEDIALQLSNDTYDDEARNAAADQVQDILEQIINIGNTIVEDRYIFAGTDTLTQPFDFNSVGVVYRGNDESIKFSIDRTTAIAGNITGSELLTKPLLTLGEDSDLNPGIARYTFLKNLHGGDGVNLGDNHFTLRTVNGEADIALTDVLSIGDVIDAINDQAAAQGLTGLTVSISEAGNSLMFEDTSDPYITSDTPLAMLNSGSGVDLEIPEFIIRDSDGTSYTIDLTGATTVGDAVDAINNAGVPDLTASITSEANTLTIIDTGGHGYTIEENGGTV